MTLSDLEWLSKIFNDTKRARSFCDNWATCRTYYAHVSVLFFYHYFFYFLIPCGRPSWLFVNSQNFGNGTKRIFLFVIDASCEDAFQLNSKCYKVHKTQRVDWFTAVNRCRSNNASLAVFDDDVRQYCPSSLLSDNVNAWIGLMKSWWTWPGLNLSLGASISSFKSFYLLSVITTVRHTC